MKTQVKSQKLTAKQRKNADMREDLFLLEKIRHELNEAASYIDQLNSVHSREVLETLVEDFQRILHEESELVAGDEPLYKVNL